MTKKEVIWREILFQSRENKINKFTQAELSKKFGFSVSTVFNSLKDLRSSGIVNVSGSFFTLQDWGKLLYRWASERNLEKEIFYKFTVRDIKKVEGSVLPEAVFGLYSGFKFAFGSTPSDYDHLYIYLEEQYLDEFLKRMRDYGADTNDAHPNVFILRPDDWMRNYRQMTKEQIFVDIWNAPEWYSKDFIKALKDKLNF